MFFNRFLLDKHQLILTQIIFVFLINFCLGNIRFGNEKTWQHLVSRFSNELSKCTRICYSHRHFILFNLIADLIPDLMADLKSFPIIYFSFALLYSTHVFRFPCFEWLWLPLVRKFKNLKTYLPAFYIRKGWFDCTWSNWPFQRFEIWVSGQFS